MATSFGEPNRAMLQPTRPAPLSEVKPGDLLKCDGLIYKIYRLIRVVNTGGWVAMAVAQNRRGEFAGESVALGFASRNETVRLVLKGVTG